MMVAWLPPANPTPVPSGSTQRQHILSTALTLMSQQGVDGTSMRNLAAAAGLNVASLYHYFPSKRDLLVAVLEEQGFVEGLAAASLPSLSRDPASDLAELLNDILSSMLEVEDFVRLMMGEVMRGDDTAYAVGGDLFAATQAVARAMAGRTPTSADPPDEQAGDGPDDPESAGRPVLRARGRCARGRDRTRSGLSGPGGRGGRRPRGQAPA